MVVQPGERNIVDQRLLEFALWDRYRVQTVRLSMAEVRHTSALKEEEAEVWKSSDEESVFSPYITDQFTMLLARLQQCSHD